MAQGLFTSVKTRISILGLLQLHMISNRARIEKQILLGRQAIRAMSRSRNYPAPLSKAALLHPTLHDEKERSRDRRSNDSSPLPTTSERPISVDTDAEEAFLHGSQWFYRRGRTRRAVSPTTDRTKEELSRDPLSSSRIRRKWASDLLSPAEGSDGEADHSRASPHREKARLSPSSFFRRLPSFRGIHLPLSSERDHEARETGHLPVNNDVWSSESSDEDTHDEFRYSHTPVMNFAAPEQDDLDDGGMDEL